MAMQPRPELSNKAGNARPLLGPDGQPIDAPYDDFAVPHVLTFASLIGSGFRTYYHDRWDEAMRHNRENGLAMRRDAFLMSLLQERILATTSLKWHLEPDTLETTKIPENGSNKPGDPRNNSQQEACEYLTKIIRNVPRLRRMSRSLMQALWFGRYGVQLKYEWTVLDGQRVLNVTKHLPVNGDKIGHQYDGTPYVLVYGASNFQDALVINTTQQKGLVLKGSWRERFYIHYHDPDDEDFFGAEQAEAVHGVGIRSRLYWLNWLRTEFISWMVDYLERVGLGLTIWYYDASNPAARAEVEKEAKAQSKRANILLPRPPGQAAGRSPGVERIETPANGIAAIQALIVHLEEQMTRYVVGQSLSGSAEGNGLGGSSVADLHADTKAKLIAADSEELGETMTGNPIQPGLVSVLKRWNLPDVTFPMRWVYDLEKPEVEKTVNAVVSLAGIGVKFKENEVRALTGLSDPVDGDDTVGGKEALNAQNGLDENGKPIDQGDGQNEPGDDFGDDGDDSFDFLNDEPRDLFNQGGLFDESKHPRAAKGPHGGEFTRGAHNAAAAAHQAAKEQYKQVRKQAWTEGIGEATKHISQVKELAKKISFESDQTEVPEEDDTEAEKAFTDLDEATVNFRNYCDNENTLQDDVQSYRDYADQLRDIQDAAEVLRDATDGTEQGIEQAKKVLAHVKEAKKALRAFGEKIKELKKIKRGEQYARQDEVIRFEQSEGGGHWVTIGGKVGKDGKRHGGSPVFIKDGKIEKGAPNLEGKPVGSLDKAPSSLPTHGHAPNWDKTQLLTHTTPHDLPEGVPTKGDNNNLVWFFPGKPKGSYGAGTYGDKHYKVKIPSNKILDLDDKKALAEFEKAYPPEVPGRQRANEYEHAFKSGYWAVKRDGEVSLRPETAKALKERGDEPTTRQAGIEHKKNEAKAWERKARAKFVKPDHLHRLAAEMKAHDAEFVKGRKELLSAARKTGAGLGTNLKALKTNIDRARVEGADQVKGLDDVAQDIASRFPEHFNGHDDPTARLYDLLAEGNPEPMSDDDAYQQALDHLAEQKRQEREAIPFAKVESGKPMKA